MGAATDGAEIVRLSKEHAELKPVADAVTAVARAREELPELEEMAKAGDAELAALAQGRDLLPRLHGLTSAVSISRTSGNNVPAGTPCLPPMLIGMHFVNRSRPS